MVKLVQRTSLGCQSTVPSPIGWCFSSSLFDYLQQYLCRCVTWPDFQTLPHQSCSFAPILAIDVQLKCRIPYSQKIVAIFFAKLCRLAWHMYIQSEGHFRTLDGNPIDGSAFC